MALVQEVGVFDGLVATGTNPWPGLSNTIPVNTGGDEYMSLVITPSSASNILSIRTKVNGSHTTGSVRGIQVAIFQDAIVNALSAGVELFHVANEEIGVIVFHRMVAGTTSPITFKVRAGVTGSTAGTMTFNGQSSVQVFGGVYDSHIVIQEIGAGGGGGGAGGGMSARTDPEKINLRISNQGLSVNHKDTGASQAIVNSKWRLVLKAWA